MMLGMRIRLARKATTPRRCIRERLLYHPGTPEQSRTALDQIVEGSQQRTLDQITIDSQDATVIFKQQRQLKLPLNKHQAHTSATIKVRDVVDNH
jgi:hypothetical protein